MNFNFLKFDDTMRLQQFALILTKPQERFRVSNIFRDWQQLFCNGRRV